MEIYRAVKDRQVLNGVEYVSVFGVRIVSSLTGEILCTINPVNVPQCMKYDLARILVRVLNDFEAKEAGLPIEAPTTRSELIEFILARASVIAQQGKSVSFDLSETEEIGHCMSKDQLDVLGAWIEETFSVFIEILSFHSIQSIASVISEQTGLYEPPTGLYEPPTGLYDP